MSSTQNDDFSSSANKTFNGFLTAVIGKNTAASCNPNSSIAFTNRVLVVLKF